MLNKQPAHGCSDIIWAFLQAPLHLVLSGGGNFYVDRAFLLPTRPAVWGSSEQQANTMESFFQGHFAYFVFQLGCTCIHSLDVPVTCHEFSPPNTERFITHETVSSLLCYECFTVHTLHSVHMYIPWSDRWAALLPTPWHQSGNWRAVPPPRNIKFLSLCSRDCMTIFFYLLTPTKHTAIYST